MEELERRQEKLLAKLTDLPSAVYVEAEGMTRGKATINPHP